MRGNFNTDNVQVGDKVIVIATGWSSRSEYIGEVIKKTPTGLVDVRYRGDTVHRFKKNGYDYTKQERFSHSSIWIEEYTEEREDTIRKCNKRNGILNFLKEREWNTYEEAELEQIYNFIKGLRST